MGQELYIQVILHLLLLPLLLLLLLLIPHLSRSCADVVVSSTVEEECGEGSREGGRCTCPRGRGGERCQYTVDCSSDMDCNGPKVVTSPLAIPQGQGKCIVTDTTVYREGRCFCAPGWQVQGTPNLLYIKTPL